MLPDVYEANLRDLAKLLKVDGVDAACIVPACPNFSMTACGIAYYLECEGIQTVGIALFGKIAQTIKPPRILWVSFRWVGHLGNPLIQSSRPRSSSAHWGCLMPSRVPLDDYPIDLPNIDKPPPACPVSFKPKRDDELWHRRLSYEVGALTPWYELG